MELQSLGLKKPLYADIIRDGGSYVFGFLASNGKSYELFIKVVIDSPSDCKRYYEPLVFLGDCNSKNAVAHPTWDEASVFLSNISFDNGRFNELKWIIENGGWNKPRIT